MTPVSSPKEEFERLIVLQAVNMAELAQEGIEDNHAFGKTISGVSWNCS